MHVADLQCCRLPMARYGRGPANDWNRRFSVTQPLQFERLFLPPFETLVDSLEPPEVGSFRTFADALMAELRRQSFV
jgi:hypothetical protein